MYRIFKNETFLTATQINENSVADECRKIFSQFKNLTAKEIIAKVYVKIIYTYHDGSYVFVDLK